MTFMNPSPKSIRFALIILVLIAFPFSITSFAKHHRGGGGHRSAKASRGSARHRGGRVASRGHRGGRQSAREARATRARVAREQASSLKSLEKRLHRPLTSRERAAEMRRIESKHRREFELARRRAEAARRAAIARARALDQAQRDETQRFIARDNTAGEDPEVRRVAVNALGNHAGTVVVMDPKTGRVYSIVNQEWGLRRGFKPCSTIKLVTGLAGLNEKVISPSEITTVADNHYHLDLTEALAHSNNTYFQQVGGRVGFDKMVAYARELGLGEKTGINAANEFGGRLPFLKSGYAVNHMSSHGDDFEVTAIQLATLVSAMANGGKLLMPRVPTSAQDDKTRLRRQLKIEPDSFQRMVPGMVGAVNYGTGKRAYDPTQTVAGKTGTCIEDGNWIGLFASYAPLVDPKLAVVVIARRSDGRGHFPAAVAGQIYRDLNRRFGTPTFLPIAQAPDGKTDDKADVLNEEKEDEKKAAAAEDEAAGTVDTSLMNSEDDAAKTDAKSAITAATAPVKSKVKPVSMPIQKKTDDATKAGANSPAPVKKAPATDVRPRRATGDQP